MWLRRSDKRPHIITATLCCAEALATNERTHAARAVYRQSAVYELSALPSANIHRRVFRLSDAVCISKELTPRPHMSLPLATCLAT